MDKNIVVWSVVKLIEEDNLTLFINKKLQKRNEFSIF